MTGRGARRGGLVGALCFVMLAGVRCVRSEPAAAPEPATAVRVGPDPQGCPTNTCAKGQVCRRRPVTSGIGVTAAVDGRCPDGTLRHECEAEPGKICCAEAVAMIDLVSHACVDVAAGCADCGCMPKDVCGADTLQVCVYATATEVICGLPP